MTQTQKFRALWDFLSQFGFGSEHGLRVNGQGVRLSENFGYDEYSIEHLFVKEGEGEEDVIYYSTRSWRNCSLPIHENHAKSSAECIYDNLMESGFKGVDRNLF